MRTRLLPLLLAVLAPRAHAQGDAAMGPGVSLALATARARQVAAVRYDLRLDVTDPDVARGRVTVRFARRAPGDVLLDFRGTLAGVVRANGRDVPDVEANGAHVRIPAHALRDGENHVEVAFTTPIATAGASIIRVRDPSDSATYLYTLLVPSDANLLFPCFDQPDLKARVTLTLVTPTGWTAVANGTRLARDSSAGGLAFRFRESEPISTYLIAFAAGPWRELQVAGTRKPITLFVRRSRSVEVEADSIILANDRAATWLEGYFATPFPFQKLDIVLAPAFPFGGMEHPGAIFYNETAFVYRERPTLPQRLGRTATIYHEVAHQWFGDLVTMRWFDDLWLKEGFATYMAARMQAALDPASEAWKTFYLRNKPSAYAVDASEGTTPVWQRLGNLDQAKSNYGAIVYNKAPSVLKQLEYAVGDSAFRRGLRGFVRRHGYGNATWRDLLAAVGGAAGASLRAWGDAYILRPGMPVLEPVVEVRDGRVRRARLVQRPARALSGRGPWPIRLELLAIDTGGRERRIPLALTRDTTEIVALRGAPAPALLFANAGDQAYALTLLDSATVGWLEGEGMARVRDPFLRAMLWGALWDMVRDARLAPSRFLDLALRQLPAEGDEQLVGGLLGRVSRATGAYLSEGQRTARQAAVEAALWQGAADAGRPYGIRKAHLDAWIRVAASPPALQQLDALLDSSSAAGAPLRAPTRWAIVTRLVARGAPGAAERLAAETARDRTPEGARGAFVAAAAEPSAAVKADYFRRYFADASLNEEWASASLDAFNDAGASTLSRPYLVAALDSLPWIQRNRRIFYLGAWVNAFIGGQGSGEALDAVQGFLRARPALAADLRAKVLQALDELERTVRIRRAFGADPAPPGASPGAANP